MGEFVIKNPIELEFDPFTCDDSDSNDEGVSIQAIFTDPIARTLWLGIRPFFMTDQYFRVNLMDAAKWISKEPPKMATALHRYTCSIVGGWPYGGVSQELSDNLFPHIVAVLMKNDRWDYFVPRGEIKELGWVRVPKKRRRQCRFCMKEFFTQAANFDEEPPDREFCKKRCEKILNAKREIYEFEKIRFEIGSLQRRVKDGPMYGNRFQLNLSAQITPKIKRAISVFD